MTCPKCLRGLLFEPSNSLALTGAGLWGYDEGVSTQLADGRILWLTGDTVGAYFDSVQSKWMGTTRQTTCSNGAGGTGPCLGVDTAVLLAPAGNEYACSHLNDVSQALLGGIVGPVIPYTNCPVFTVITDPAHGATKAKMVYLSEHVSGLSGSESMLGGRTPRGMVAIGTALYIVYGTNGQTRSRLTYHTESSLLKVADTTAITSTSFPTMTKLINFSVSPPIPNGTVTVTIGSPIVTRQSGSTFDPAWIDLTRWSLFEVDGVEYQIQSVDTGNQITLTTPITAGKTCLSGTCSSILFSAPPSITTRTGKFMFCGMDSFTRAQTISYGWNAKLPGALQSASNVVIAACSGFYYRHSNVSLLAIDASLLDSSTNSGTGVSNAWYMAGLDGNNDPTWVRGDEASAAPLLTSWANASGDPCVGEMSTRYIPVLRRMVMTYGAAECGGIRARTASYPWGPWSEDTKVLPNVADQGWEGRLIYAPNDPRNPNFNQTATVGVRLYDASQPCCVVLTASTGGSPFSLPGNGYGPWLWPASTAHDNGDGTATVLTNLSGFDPYVVWQAKITFLIPLSVSITAPANGATVSGTVTVSASAGNNVGVAGVQFLLDGAALGAEVTAPPYTISWNSGASTNGAHSLSAVARDGLGI